MKCLMSLQHYNVCEGVDKFSALVESKHGIHGEIPVTVTGNDVVQFHPFKTVRHKHCALLIPTSTTRCQVCKRHRSDLASLDKRLSAKSSGSEVSTKSSTRNDLLSQKDLIKKVNLLSSEKNQLKRRISMMASKIEDMVMEEGTVLPPDQEDKLQISIKKNYNVLKTLLDENSPGFLLWEQQKKSASRGKGMRWHPAIICWCIALHHKSSSAYNLIRDSGFLQLPSTLHPYSHFGNPRTGVNADMLTRLIRDINIKSLPGYELNVSVAFDEMKVKTDLVYNTRSGRIVGFMDVGGIANAITSFERKCQGEVDPPLATHVLVLMVRGIFNSLHSPIAFYATCGVSSYQLLALMDEAIMCQMVRHPTESFIDCLARCK
ncbi:LOW QUALITY PROTEIN: uncharacterized protein LOC110989404 [Acanthaster planci]|uniref:LOW QUALITY PROTEIN: uncharacterized protein LOC110989404 n=1 Tax=Acanthaster planci TaxID=133434 RepID=A0A8B7ZXI8_ACAPL|nr:LOW QUALITY PROTEIN: uncharacterized protein LOC110989404 [Acanthaster planci]